MCTRKENRSNNKQFINMDTITRIFTFNDIKI